MGNRSNKRRRRRKEKGRAIVPSGPVPNSPSREIIHQQQISSQLYSGPVPHPDLLRGYGEIDEAFPQRILKMAEDEQSHRHDMERQSLEAQKNDLKHGRAEARLGQVFGLIIGLTAIVGGVVAAVMGAQWSGSIIGGGGVIGLVAVFIQGRQYPANAQESKKK